MRWFTDILKEGGLLICGSNWTQSRRCRYTVYRKEQAQLVEKEFAFSLDNLRPTVAIIGWLGFRDDDHESIRLAEAAGVIRADDEFRRDFDARLNDLLAEKGLYERGDDGYLTEIATDLSRREQDVCLAEISEQLDREGYLDGAVAALKRAGYDAWRNSVGHVSVAAESLSGNMNAL